MIDKNRHIDIMGIVNLTDDSYFAGSRCADADSALARIRRMVEEGATIIDIGACSTRPGSLPVGAEEEWSRLKPVLEVVRRSFPDVRISIDTYWSSVVRNAYNLIGEFMVNDISAGEEDPEMLPLVGSLGLPYVAMHRHGIHENMHELTDCNDILSDVLGFFKEFAVKADRYNLKSWIIDPGFGFSKTIVQNYEVLGGLADLHKLAEDMEKVSGILVGVSRKSMIYRLLGLSPEECLPATQALHLYALERGADILRVHDVAEAVDTVTLYRALR